MNSAQFPITFAFIEYRLLAKKFNAKLPDAISKNYFPITVQTIFITLKYNIKYRGENHFGVLLRIFYDL